MGADYEGQEAGIEKLRQMPEEAREYLLHHVNNSLVVIIGNIELALMELRRKTDTPVVERIRAALEAAGHMRADIRKIGY